MAKVDVSSCEWLKRMLDVVLKLLVQGIALGLSDDDKFGSGKGAWQGERTGAKASFWMSFRWIYLNRNRLSMCQHLLGCLLVSSPMDHTWIL